MTASEFQFDSGDGDHPPGLYEPRGVADGIGGLGAVGDEQVAFYHEHGYLVVHGVLDQAQLQTAVDAIDDLIAGKNERFKGVSFEAPAQGGIEHLSASQRRDQVRKIYHFVQFDERLGALAGDAAMLDVVRRLLGGREPKLFQDMALLKPPKVGREKPWHQDRAYFGVDLEDPIIGVWIALDTATIDNGCMQLIDRGHRAGPRVHFKRRDWQICDSEMLGHRSLAVPLEPGGTLFFDSLMPHGTPNNRSDQRRRALQFHYAPVDAKRVPNATRMSIFGDEGKDVSC